MSLRWKSSHRKSFTRAWAFTFLCIFQLAAETTQLQPSVCYPTKESFEAMCTVKNGVVDGGRCFYFHSETGDWTKAWAHCTADGGILAQVMTLREVNLATPALIQKATGEALGPKLLTAQRDPTESKPPCSITMDTTYWYDNETYANPKLVAANTISKYYTIENKGCVDTDTVKGPRCLGIRHFDWSCGETNAYAFCMITNGWQSFAPTDYCMTEVVIESIDAGISEPLDCARACTERTWCRSFNYVHGSSDPAQCQLFCRSIYDCQDDASKCPSTVMKNEMCSHYNYV